MTMTMVAQFSSAVVLFREPGNEKARRLRRGGNLFTPALSLDMAAPGLFGTWNKVLVGPEGCRRSYSAVLPE